MRWLSQGEALVPKDDLSWLSASGAPALGRDAVHETPSGVPPGPVDGEAGRGRGGGPADRTVRARGSRGRTAPPMAPRSRASTVRRCRAGCRSPTGRAGPCAPCPHRGSRWVATSSWSSTAAAAFVADYFTPAEQALAHRAPSERDWQRVTNLIWSAKESALKVLRTGLRRDTRSVEVTLGDGDGDDWVPLTVEERRGLHVPRLVAAVRHLHLDRGRA